MLKYSIHSAENNIAPFLFLLAIFTLPLLIYPSANNTLVSNSDVHALLEFSTALLAVTAGVKVLIYFFTTCGQLFLVISYGLIFVGGEQFIHGIFSFNRVWAVIPPAFKAAIPITWLTGHFVLAVTFLLALLLRAKRRRFVALLTIHFAVLFLATAALAQAGTPLRFVSDEAYPPISYFYGAQPKGLGVDLARAVAEQLGRPVEVSLLPWSDAQAQLQHGKADFIGPMTITPQRRELYDFTTPFYLFEYVFLVNEDKPGVKSLKDLAGKRVGITAGGYPYQRLKGESALTLVVVDNTEQAIHWLREGKIDAYAVDKWVATYELGLLGVHDVVVAGPPFETREAALAVRKGNAELLTELERAMGTLIQDGTYRRIHDRWMRANVIVLTEQEKAESDRLIQIIGLTFLGSLVLSGVWLFFLTRAFRRSTRALRESEERFRTVVERAPEGIFIQTRQRFAYVNAATVRLFGAAAPEQLLGEMVEDRMHLDCRARVRERIRLLNEERWPQPPADLVYLQLDGSPRHVIVSAVPFEFKGEHGALVFVRDITERKQAEEAATEYLRLLHTLTESSTDAIYVKDTEGRYLLFNSEAARVTGKLPEEVLGKDDRFIFPPDEAATVMDADRKVFEGGTVQTFDEVVTTTAGVRCFLSIKGPIHDENGNLIGLFGIARDITERKQAEKLLQESEHEFRLLAESMPQMVWATRPDGWSIYFNRQWTDYTGQSMEESYGHGWNKPFHPEDQQRAWDAWQNAVNNMGTYSLECRLRRFDGVYKWFLIRGVPVLGDDGAILKWFGTCTDIDEFKQAEEEKSKLESQLMQAQKMESIGRLAGGVAHDFNNMLSIILGHTQLALAELEPSSPLNDNLQEILSATNRSANLTRQLLAFARKQSIAPKVLDLNETTSSMLKMLQRLIGEDIHLTWHPATKLWLVNMDPSQIDQLLANLCVNARDAIKDNGKITIETANATFDNQYCKANANVIDLSDAFVSWVKPL